MPAFFAFAAIILIGQGIHHIIRAVKLILKWQDSKNWIETIARIVKSEVSGFSFMRTGGRKKGRLERRFVPDIEYEYKVNLVPYRSKQLFWMRNLVRNTFDDADNIASQYPIGMFLNIHYNPDKPSEAIWDMKDAHKLWWELGASFLELGIGIFVLYYAIHLQAITYGVG